jgi:outer membrane protein OmpA-like peptidoglycan-associated protein
MARVTTHGSRALVRNGPGTNHMVVGSRNNGDIVEILERRAGWARIGTGQWISEALLADTTELGGDVIPHESRPNDLRWRILVNFATNSSELRPEHQQWLRRTATAQARAGQRIWVRGLASRLGDAATNQALSERRAAAVRDFLVRQCGIGADRITGVHASVGEAWSRGSATDNSGRWRAVEVIITNNPVELPPTYIGGRSPLSTVFYVKYLGGGGGGEGVEIQVANFVIRASNDYWQKYTFGGVGPGVGVPLGWGDPMPRGRGWVEFRTHSPVTVSDFTGKARISQASAQVGPGLSYFVLAINHATCPIELPTGKGFSIGLS